MDRSTKRFAFFEDLFIYFVFTYVHVSSLLLSSVNLCGTMSYE